MSEPRGQNPAKQKPRDQKQCDQNPRDQKHVTKTRDQKPFDHLF